MEIKLPPYSTKSFPFEIKAVNADEGQFEGYASVFGNIDSYGEIIDEGAFTKTIAENARRVKVCFNHDWMNPIGRPLTMEADHHGLFVKAKISQTSIGKDVITLMRDGVVTEMSIGFETTKDTFVEGVRHLQEVRLWEFSPVTWAANDLALVTGVKSLTGSPLEIKIGLITECSKYLREFMIEQKAGKVISEANMRLLDSAIESLQALKLSAKPLDDNTLGDGEPPRGQDIEAQELKSILDGMQSIMKNIKGE